MSVRDRFDDALAAGQPTPGGETFPAILDVQIRFTPSLTVVRLVGELDLGSVHQLADALGCIAATSCQTRLVMLDLSGLTFCDVAGLRAIETCAATLGAAGKELVLHDLPRSVTRLIDITGVARWLAHH